MPANLTLNSFFSMGSPIALYGLRYGLDNFTKPIKPKAWINFCYPQDLIAYPLKSLNSTYASAVTKDAILQPGPSSNLMLTIRNLIIGHTVGVFSHSWYWEDPRVIKMIARTLANP